MLNSARRVSEGSSVGATSPGQAARMLTPGAMTSGLRTYSDSPLGPLDENDATTGAGLAPISVPRKIRAAVGFGWEFMYPRTLLPSDSVTESPGMT
nr:hypothetical protein TorRG33x02_142890 [Ipomoea trifida]GMD22076.1 hypothetical protein TorRG33x02_142890 [Ipomoea batatas]